MEWTVIGYVYICMHAGRRSEVRLQDQRRWRHLRKKWKRLQELACFVDLIQAAEFPFHAICKSIIQKLTLTRLHYANLPKSDSNILKWKHLKAFFSGTNPTIRLQPNNGLFLYLYSFQRKTNCMKGTNSHSIITFISCPPFSNLHRAVLLLKLSLAPPKVCIRNWK